MHVRYAVVSFPGHNDVSINCIVLTSWSGYETTRALGSLYVTSGVCGK